MSKLKLKQEEKRTMYINYIDNMYCAIDESTGKSEFACYFWEDMRECIKVYQRIGCIIKYDDVVRALNFIA